MENKNIIGKIVNNRNIHVNYTIEYAYRKKGLFKCFREYKHTIDFQTITIPYYLNKENSPSSDLYKVCEDSVSSKELSKGIFIEVVSKEFTRKCEDLYDREIIIKNISLSAKRPVISTFEILDLKID